MFAAYITPIRAVRARFPLFFITSVNCMVYITPIWGIGGYQLPGENGFFVALRLLRMTEEIITAQDDRGSFARCILRAVDDRLYDRCYVNRVIFNS